MFLLFYASMIKHQYIENFAYLVDKINWNNQKANTLRFNTKSVNNMTIRLPPKIIIFQVSKVICLRSLADLRKIWVGWDWAGRSGYSWWVDGTIGCEKVGGTGSVEKALLYVGDCEA